MKKRDVNAFRNPHERAAFVIAHAKWQAQRGRRPSEPYWSFARGIIRDPSRALAVAQQDIAQEIEGVVGEDVRNYVRRLIRYAHLLGRVVTGTHNSIQIVVDPNEYNPDKLLKEWQVKMQKRAEEWKNSDEGKESRERDHARHVKCRARIVELVSILPDVDFSSMKNVLDWLYEYAEIADYSLVKNEAHLVSSVLESHGLTFADGVPRRAEPIDEREVVGKVIVASAVDMMQKNGHIHQVVLTWIEQWQNGFQQALAAQS